jgi:CheY-like chemotaxis protein
MKEYYLEHGFQDYLSKPISPRALDEEIRKQMNKEQRTVNNEQLADGDRNFSVAMRAQRVDMLNHYRESFSLVPEAEWQEKFDKAYFERFTALIESFNSINVFLSAQVTLLAEAGRRGDVLKIRDMLPAFYEALRSRKTGTSNVNNGILDTRVGVILIKLKKALQDGETKTAETLLGELGTISLSADSRALYFLLYHFMLTGETEKALGAIMLREKMEQS